MTRAELAALIDHTLLRPDAKIIEVHQACDEAMEYGFAAVCVAPRHVPLCVKHLNGAQNSFGDIHVATVCGFPNGDLLTSAKADATKRAIDVGAHEIDMVIPIGAALDEDWGYVRNDIAAVVHAAHGLAIIKVILETGYLNHEQKRQVSLIAKEEGADYVKTSTGFGPGGATVEDVRLMREIVGDTVGVKAAGGIRDLTTALALVEAGATRLGCSQSVALIEATDF